MEEYGASEGVEYAPSETESRLSSSPGGDEDDVAVAMNLMDVARREEFYSPGSTTYVTAQTRLEDLDNEYASSPPPQPVLQQREPKPAIRRRDDNDRLSRKISSQAQELLRLRQELDKSKRYASLCEQRVVDLCPGHKLPVREKHIGSGKPASSSMSNDVRHRRELQEQRRAYARLNREYDAAQKRITELTRSNRNLRRKGTGGATTTTSSKIPKRTALERQNRNLSKSLRGEAKTVEELRSQIAVLQEALQVKAVELGLNGHAQLLTQTARMRGEIDALKAQLREAMEARAQAEIQRDDISKQLKQARKTQETQQNQLTKMKRELRREGKEDLHKSIHQLETHKNALIDYVQDNAERTAKLTSEYEEIKTKNERLNDQAEHLTQQMSQAKSKIEKLEQSLRNSETKRERAEKESTEAQIEKNQMEIQMQQRAAEMEELAAIQADLLNDLRDANDRASETERDLEDLSKKYKDVSDRAKDLQRQLDAVMEARRVEFSRSETEVKDSERKVLQMQADLERSKRRSRELHSECRSQANRIEDLVSKLQRMKSKQDLKEKDIVDLKSSEQELRDELRRSRSKNVTFSSATEMLGRVQNLCDEVEALSVSLMKRLLTTARSEDSKHAEIGEELETFLESQSLKELLPKFTHLFRYVSESFVGEMEKHLKIRNKLSSLDEEREVERGFLHKEIESLRKRLEQAESSVEPLKHEITNLSEEVEVTRQRFRKSRDMTESVKRDARRQIEELESAKIDQAQRLNDALNRALEEAQNKARDTIVHMKGQNERERAELLDTIHALQQAAASSARALSEAKSSSTLPPRIRYTTDNENNLRRDMQNQKLSYDAMNARFQADIESKDRELRSLMSTVSQMATALETTRDLLSSKIESVRRTCPVSVVKQCAERFMTLMRTSSDDDVSLVLIAQQIVRILDVSINRSETLTRDLQDRSQRLEKVERERISAADNLSSLRHEIESCRMMAKDGDDRAQRLERERENLEARVRDQSLKIQNLTSQLAESRISQTKTVQAEQQVQEVLEMAEKERLRGLRSEKLVEDLKTRLSRAQQDLREANTRHEDVSKRLNEIQIAKSTFEASRQATERRIEEADRELQRERQRVRELQNQIAREKVQETELRAALDVQRKEASKRKSTISKMATGQKHLQERVSHDLQVLNEKHESLLERFRRSQNEKIRLEHVVEKLEQNLKMEKKRTEELERGDTAQRRLVTNLRDELFRLKTGGGGDVTIVRRRDDELIDSLGGLSNTSSSRGGGLAASRLSFEPTEDTRGRLSASQLNNAVPPIRSSSSSGSRFPPGLTPAHPHHAKALHVHRDGSVDIEFPPSRSTNSSGVHVSRHGSVTLGRTGENLLSKSTTNGTTIQEQYDRVKRLYSSFR